MGVFCGASFFLSRSLLPPDVIDRLHDLLTQQGAACVNMCCDPSAHSPVDFHVLFSPDSDKSRALQANGCQVLGPNCVFQCAQQSKPLPRRPCTCCLALDGIRVHADGFDDSELKAKIEWLVTSMCGTLDAAISSSTDFAIVKSVSCPTYKIACRHKKPVVSLSWLEACSREHKLVPHEPHKLPALSGLNICATQVDGDMRVRIAGAANQNGAYYSPDLTRECTHLIANSPSGAKFVASKSWGIKVVNQDWLWQSVASKVCVDEELFPVPTQGRDAPASISNPSDVNQSHSGDMAEDGEPQSGSSWMEVQSYLANCRFYLAGFESDGLKRLVDIVLDGGATRYLELNRTVTHVVLGKASDSELKRVQRACAGGAMQVVTPAWLEECAQKRRQVDVTKLHVPAQILPGSLPSGTLLERPQRVQSLSAIPATDVRSVELDTKEQQADARGIFSGLSFAFLESSNDQESMENHVKSAGGSVEALPNETDYVIGVHGCHRLLLPELSAKVVSVHWLQQCLQEGKLLDSQEHILYRPLPCRIPLPGFGKISLCISQYEEKDRVLCRHLCVVLGARFSNTLTRKVTHLLCKAGHGEKFQAAVLLGIPAVTIEWVYACVAQNAVVALEGYRPCSVQSPSSGGLSALAQNCRFEVDCSSGKRRLPNNKTSDACKRSAGCEESGFDAWEVLTASWSGGGAGKEGVAKHTERDLSQRGGESEDALSPQPDVAAAIEHLLAQTTKAKGAGDVSGEEENSCGLLPEATVKDERNPLFQKLRRGGSSEHEGDLNVASNGGEQGYEIESQIVAYDEDHSGKQMIMERVRAGSSTGCRRVPKSAKTLALGRLFQAAEANK